MSLYSNPNDFRRGRGTPRPRSANSLLAAAASMAQSMAATEVNVAHAELEGAAADRLDRRHILEVRAEMPYISQCRASGKQIRRVPGRILRTVEALKLVGAHDCITKRKPQGGKHG